MRIGVVVVTLNSRSIISRCLDSVYSQSCDDMEVVVVDNGSSDGTVEFINELYPQVSVFSNISNEGAAAARNKGISSLSGDWVLTLDADTRIDSDFFDSFKNFLTAGGCGRIGIVAPKIFYADGQTIYSLGNELTFLRRFYDIGKGRRVRPSNKNPSRVFGGCSAAAFYNRSMLEEVKVGGAYFDAEFFFMAEDVDLAWRARKKGWGVLSCGFCRAYHDGDSSKTPRKKKIFYSIRNRFLMIAKNDDPLYLSVCIAPLLFFEVARFIFLLVSGLGGVYLTAILSAGIIIQRYRREGKI